MGRWFRTGRSCGRLFHEYGRGESCCGALDGENVDAADGTIVGNEDDIIGGTAAGLADGFFEDGTADGTIDCTL